ncbi:MAG: S41 family peptidase, partial [Clostridia bacterium]|nr:S41 family peptidase [Clostridia bacterium]
SELGFEITKAKYERVDVAYRAIGNIGYSYIHSFGANTCDQFENAIGELVGQDCKGFVLDVRDNAGGSLSAVCDVLDVLLPAGSLVRLTSKDGTVTEDYISNAKELGMPMVVIVNEGTASAAELFAADLRDRKDVKLVGTKTVGKGTLQRTFPLSDGSAVSITVATFAPPVSDSFNGVGITPDFPVSLPDPDSNFHLLNETTDNQLSTAISVLGYSMPEETTVDENSEAPQQ